MYTDFPGVIFCSMQCYIVKSLFSKKYVVVFATIIATSV